MIIYMSVYMFDLKDFIYRYQQLLINMKKIFLT